MSEELPQDEVIAAESRGVVAEWVGPDGRRSSIHVTRHGLVMAAAA